MTEPGNPRTQDGCWQGQRQGVPPWIWDARGGAGGGGPQLGNGPPTGPTRTRSLRIRSFGRAHAVFAFFRRSLNPFLRPLACRREEVLHPNCIPIMPTSYTLHASFSNVVEHMFIGLATTHPVFSQRLAAAVVATLLATVSGCRQFFRVLPSLIAPESSGTTSCG